MSMPKPAIRKVPSLHRAAAGFAVLLALPATAQAATRACTIEFHVSNATELGALQLAIDYAGASDVGDLVEGSCAVIPSGLEDSDVDTVANTATIGWADATGFDGPAAFASCTFEMPNTLSSDPVPVDFAVTVEDASNHDIPATAADPAPTIAVVVTDCGIVSGCDAAPLSGCKLPTVTGKSKISFKDDSANPGSNVKDQGQFQWKSGAATMLGDFETPTAAGAVVSWCIYHNGALVESYDVPTGTGWLASGTTGFQFKGDVNGISQIKLKSGIDGKASVSVKGKSKAGTFASPDLPMTGTVVSQLVIDGASTHCFQSTGGTAKKNDDNAYQAAGNP